MRGGYISLPARTLRRRMHRRFARRLDAVLYGQRWQSETVNSMIKRNLAHFGQNVVTVDATTISDKSNLS